MKLTHEQSQIVDYVRETLKEDTSNNIVLVDSVAGSGKTSLLTSITAAVPHRSGLYIAYNKSIATEAGRKFPASIACSTIHSLAYRSVVKAYGLHVKNISWSDLPRHLSYELKKQILSHIRDYCLSKHTCIDEYFESNDIDSSDILATSIKDHLEKMYQGKAPCSHDFYLKVFHIGLVDKSIEFEMHDFLFLDESGDLTEVTLGIFKSLPAKVKVAVGDNCQNIYGFNNTVNGFQLLADEGRTFSLTKSFRVSTEIAKQVEAFCKRHIDPEFIFEGTELTDRSIKERAIISSTNAGLISAALVLNQSNTPYTLVRKVDDVFRLPRMVAYFKHKGEIKVPGYSHLQKDINDWYETDTLKMRYKNVLGYLEELYEDDVQLVSAIRLIRARGRQEILAAYEVAKSYEKKKTNMWLTTAHSSKGLEFDEVTIAGDLNRSVESALFDPTVTEYDRTQTLNLYYVACSRAKKSLIGATALGL